MSDADAFVREIQSEFPSFRIRPKAESRLQRAIDIALRVVTFGQMKTYLTRYHTVLFGTLWVPTSWPTMPDLDRVILLRHERVHLRQRRRMGDVGMAFVYLVWPLPIGLAWGRARIEWEAYTETIVATLELKGEASVRALREHLIERYTGPDYGWMWPFPKTIGRWFDEALRKAREQQKMPESDVSAAAPAERSA